MADWVLSAVLTVLADLFAEDRDSLVLTAESVLRAVLELLASAALALRS